MQTHAANIVSLSEYRQARTDRAVRPAETSPPLLTPVVLVWMPVWVFPPAPALPSVQTKA
jgi:hypothetical protein